MKPLLILFFSICFCGTYSQPAGIVRLKNKRNKTIKMFFVGDHFTFETKDGFIRDGVILNIQDDSVHVTSFNIKTIINYWGGNSIDTLNRFSDAFSYKDIKRILIKNRSDIPITHFAQPLKLGGLFFIFINAFNSIYLHDSFTGTGNLIKVGVAAIVSATGFVLEKIMHTEKFSKQSDVIEYIGPPVKK